MATAYISIATLLLGIRIGMWSIDKHIMVARKELFTLVVIAMWPVFLVLLIISTLTTSKETDTQ